MTVPDEAVEAARSVLHPYVDDDHFDLTEVVRAALTAAAPFIAAQALSEAADQFHARLPDGTGNGRAYNSHQVALILREQSESVRGKA